MCSRKSRATPAESKEVTVGMVWIRLDRWSTTTRTVLYPFESRSSPIMSMEITCQHQSGTLLGISFPTFCVGKLIPNKRSEEHSELQSLRHLVCRLLLD